MGKKSREKRERSQVSGPRDLGSRPPVERLLPPRQVLLVAAAALLLRAVYALLYRDSPFFHSPVVDAQTFHLWAEAIRDGRTFMPGVFFKPPLYAYALAFLYDLFGPRPAPVYLVQSLLGAGTCVCVLGLGRLTLAPRAALGGALICAALPVLVFLEFQLVAEPLTTCLTMAALLILIAGEERPWRTALSGLLLGIAALGRPNLLILAPVLAWWLWRRGGGRLQPAVILIVAAGLGIAPATLHNLRQGSFVLVSANAGANLWTGIRPAADGVEAIPIGIQWDDLQLEAAQAGAGDPAAADAWLVRRALKQAAADPPRALGLLARKALLLLSAQEGRNNIGADYLARTQGIVLLRRWWPGFWLMAPFALLGLMAVLRPALFGAGRLPPACTPILLSLAVLALAVLPFFVNARFRQPVLPLLALFAAHGLAVLVAAMRANRHRLLAAVGCLALAAIVVNVRWFDTNRPRNDAIDELQLAGILYKGYPGHSPDPEAALLRLANAARLDPQNPDVFERWGLYLQGAAYDLVEAADRAQRLNRDPGPLRSAAVSRLQQAADLHRQAVRLYPRSFRSYGSLGAVLSLLGRLDGQEADAALAAGDTLGARQRAVAAASHLEAAIAAWQQGAQMQPHLPGARDGLAASYEALAALPELAAEITAAKERWLPRPRSP